MCILSTKIKEYVDWINPQVEHLILMIDEVKEYIDFEYSIPSSFKRFDFSTLCYNYRFLQMKFYQFFFYNNLRV